MDRGKRHILLLFRNKYRSHRALYLAVFLLCIGLYAFLYLAPDNLIKPILDLGPTVWKYTWIILLVAGIAFVLFLFRLIASRIPYVQCTEKNFKVQTPLYPIVFSYKRVQATRPNALFEIFKKDKVSGSQARFLEKYSGQTAIVVDMTSLPMSLRWLKFWMTDLMFSSDGRSVVLWVQDWMTLNRELSDFKDKWRDRNMKKDDAIALSPYARFLKDK